MLKKLVILGIVGFVAVAAVKGSKFGSYIRSEFEAMKARAEANVPPEREIAVLRDVGATLLPRYIERRSLTPLPAQHGVPAQRPEIEVEIGDGARIRNEVERLRRHERFGRTVVRARNEWLHVRLER